MSIYLTIELLDTCVKNCNVHFHKHVNDQGLIFILLKLLKSRRKKLTVIDKLSSKYKGQLWTRIEDKALSIIQLYADAFMMMEDKYPTFMKVYRLLRKEGVNFPSRDPNERYLIQYEGIESPAFELAEIEYQLKHPNEPIPQCPIRPRISRIKKTLPRGTHLNMLNPELTSEDYGILNNTLPLFDEITQELNTIEDSNTEYAQNLLSSTQNLREKLILIVFHKAGNGVSSSDTKQILKILDLVNSKLDAWDRAIDILRSGRTHNYKADTLQPTFLTSSLNSSPKTLNHRTSESCNIDLLFI